MSDDTASSDDNVSQDTPDTPAKSAPYRTAAEVAGLKRPDELSVTPGLSHSAGLRPVPDSTAPSTATGEPVPHVYGPGQNPVDPVAAGLDTRAVLQTRAENRVVTHTGEDAAGPRPHTYIEKTGPEQVPQAAPADNQLEAAPADAVADAAPGPNSVAPPAA